jgi:hypothetical protein
MTVPISQSLDKDIKDFAEKLPGHIIAGNRIYIENLLRDIFTKIMAAIGDVVDTDSSSIIIDTDNTGDGEYWKVMHDSPDPEAAKPLMTVKETGEIKVYDKDGVLIYTLNSSGNIIPTGTVDGRDVSVDGAALDTHISSGPHYWSRVLTTLSPLNAGDDVDLGIGDLKSERIQSKIEPVYNVKQWGLIGDGVADDAPALQTLVTTVGGADGGVIYFPKGIYLLNSAINFGNFPNITMIGDGIYISELRCTNNVSGIIFSNIARRSYFRDINITNIKLQLGVAAFSFGSPCYNISFERVSISFYPSVNDGICIQLTGALVDFKDCIFTGATNLGTAIQLESCSHIDINNCWFLRGNKVINIQTADNTRISIRRCMFGYNPVTAITVDDGYNISIDDCSMGATTYGIHLKATAYCFAVVIKNCLITGGTKDIKAEAGVMGCSLLLNEYSAIDYSMIDGIGSFDTILGLTDPFDYYPTILKSVETITANGVISAAGGLVSKYASSDAGGVIPTDAALDAAFGTPATVGAGFMGIYQNTNVGDGKTYVVTTDGTDWYYMASTKAL